MTYIDPLFEGIGSISPPAMESYLSERGWKPKRNTGTATIYRKEFEQSWDEVSVPNDITFSDYLDIVFSAVRTISKVESRPAADVLADILSGNSGGWIQYRLETEDDSGTVPVDRVLQVIRAHKGMSKAVCLGDEEVLSNMRMGQTGYGGYLLRFAYTQSPRSFDSGREDMAEVVFALMVDLVGYTTEGIGSPSSCGISSDFVDSFMGLRSDRGLGIEISLVSGRKANRMLTVSDETFSSIERIFG